MVRVFVTGITGFIGRSLAKRLAEEGYTVYGLVRFLSEGRRAVENAEIITGDLTDYYSVERAVKLTRPEVVFHLAALSPVSESYFQPATYAETNYIGTIHLLETLRRYARETLRLVAVAGTTEMFDSTEDLDGYNELRPESPYAVSKIGEMLYAEYMYRAYGLPIVTAIPTNTYGRAPVRQRHFFIEKLITEMLEDRQDIYLGNPDAMRDWMFREDHVDAYVHIMKAALDGRPVFGRRFAFGTGVGYTTKETAEMVKRLVGSKAVLRWNALQRPAETHRIVISKEAIRRAYEALGWRPKYALEEGLRVAIKEWREVLGKQ
jgi:nucleoside-diphosphate-sugar epimerase